MAYFDQAHFDVRCEWGVEGIQNLAPADFIVIVDVLSFSTSVNIAAESDISDAVPMLVDDAFIN